jgi:hypothetical protein
MTVKAKESHQIQKVRKKIKEKIHEAEKQMSPEALLAMSYLIKQQLNRKKEGRINLKERQVTSFDENRHPAKTQSKFILKLIHQIKHPPKKDLTGRITSIKKT